MHEPDMKIPISSIFFKFNNYSNSYKNFNFTKYSNLEFFPIDDNKFPAIKLGQRVMKMGGLAPHVFNYLNETLLNLFIKNKIKFIDIVKFNEINLEMYLKKW